MLPDGKSPSLGLVQPTPTELITQYTKNGVEWRGALSIEAYLRREAHLAKTALSSDSGITYWVLVDTSLKPEERTVLAGCETLRKRALVSRKSQVTEAICHGVGSVFTPLETRGHGYGARMIRELGEKLKSWQADSSTSANFSVLYSDIGKKFYTKAGWNPFRSSHVALRPRAPASTNGHANSSSNGNVSGNTNGHVNGHAKAEVRPLYADDLAELCKADETMIRERLSQPRDNTAVVLIPDLKTIQWHHAREEFVSGELLGEKPLIKGAITEADGRRVWAIFTRVWSSEDPNKRNDNVLHLLRIVVEESAEEVNEDEAVVDALARIFAFAQEEAERWRCEQIEIWNPHERTVQAAQRVEPDVKVIDREEESITSLKWYDDSDGRVEWLENEKFGWC